ncbi:MAG: hypothetical protein EAZ74_01110 [Alphaproteobacteria bacterium]|nr:MAG: hypothetical protein EAZ74_01110 [Alphaproteobacteria bacterium]TAF76999.1 MAG: hypothetical protein EAZ52_02440 [Alphaproteobacteria bacterium]
MLRLLMLPFQMFRMIRKILWRIIWHFVYFFLLKPQRLLYFTALIIVISWLMPDNRSVSSAPPPLEPIKPMIEKSDQVVSTLPKIKGTIRNVNSVFNASSLDIMGDMERHNYYKHFYHVMTHEQADVPYRWKISDNFFGSLTAQAPFKARSGVMCRFYKELLSYRGQHESFDGLACQRQRGGWCRLRPQSAHTCSLGKPSKMDMFFNNLF